MRTMRALTNGLCTLRSSPTVRRGRDLTQTLLQNLENSPQECRGSILKLSITVALTYDRSSSSLGGKDHGIKLLLIVSARHCQRKERLFPRLERN